jgi:transposase
VLADVAKASLAIEAVRRIDTIFDVEREINGLSATQRHSLRQLRVAPLVMSLEQWMRAERGRLSRHADIAKAMDYMLSRKTAVSPLWMSTTSQLSCLPRWVSRISGNCSTI